MPEKLTPATLEKICSAVARDYPSFINVKPKVSGAGEQYRLVFEKSEKTDDGLTIKLILRVKADAKGNIVQVSTSK